MAADPTDPNEFRRVLGSFPTGVTVVTGVDDQGPIGMAIGSFVSVSLDPPLVGFLPQVSSSTWTRLKETGSFCVNVLGEDQGDVCAIFASKADDKFAGIEWTTAATGSPIIPGSIAWIDCDVHAIHDGGDHDVVLGLVKAFDSTDHTGPLLFYKGGYGRYEEL